MLKVCIIDYGVSNLFSVSRAMEHLGVEPIVSIDPEAITSAEKLILPGVGAFPDAMEALERANIAELLQSTVFAGTPILGICLGAQLLFTRSYEFGETNGLNLISGDVVPVKSQTTDGKPLRVPHIGWNELRINIDHPVTESLLAGIDQGRSAYFVHSFFADIANKEACVATCDYGGWALPSVVGQGNAMGCQFHPERSGEVGLQLLRNFLSL